MAGTGCVLDASRRVCTAVVVCYGSAQQLQHRVLTDMRKWEVLEERVVCSFVTRSSSGAAASIPAIHVGEASHPNAACWCVGVARKERERRGKAAHHVSEW